MSGVNKTLSSWGGNQSVGSKVYRTSWRSEPLPKVSTKLLAYGMGRSYGDSCLLNNGTFIETHDLNHFISFDSSRGLIRVEAGCTMAALLRFCVPHGWFAPVTPGTKFVTLGGCLANDIHGKNHHNAGSFGCFVPRFGLRRSDGSELECSPDRNPELFCATIGGLGLTGLILWLELQLKPIRSPLISQTKTLLSGLDSFFEHAEKEEAEFEYSVAWLDVTHKGKPRGVFLAGNHAKQASALEHTLPVPLLSLPFQLPDAALSGWSIGLMNSGYYLSNVFSPKRNELFYDSFFYPLDSVAHWNRAYGAKGLRQYQFVVPRQNGLDVLAEVLDKVQVARQSSFLTVVKLFGNRRSPGILSFPRAGVTVCFDFPNLGAATERLLDDLDTTVFSCGGALYPAKDCRMSPDAFERSFPKHKEFKKWIDPAFASTFSQRIGLTS
ncbi:MAG: FAD-binding oxidoreductase [Blastochloris sp.]|nr:FAD-binding oxidoreductase [Blastochloris sp.]